MTAREVNWLRDAYNLVYRYRRSDTVRRRVNSTFLYNSRPVFFYVETLIRFSPNYFRYYRQIFQRDISYFSSRRVRQTWGDDLFRRLWTFFDRCETDRNEFVRILQVLSSPAAAYPLYSAVEARRLAALEEQVRIQKQPDLITQFLDRASRTKEAKTETVQKPLAETQPLSSRIQKYKEQLENPVTRELLIRKGFFTKEEAAEIDRLGLLKIEKFKDEEDWKKKVELVASKLKPKEEPVPPEGFLKMERIAKEIQSRPPQAIPEREERQPTPQIPTKVLEKITKEEKAPPRPSIPRLPRPELPPAAKEFVSQGQIAARRAGAATLRGLGGMGSSLLRGGGGLALRGGGAIASVAARGLLALAAGSVGLPIVAGIILAVVLIVGLAFLPIFFDMNRTASLFPPDGVAQAQPIRPGPSPGPGTCDTTGVDILGANAVTDEALSEFISREKSGPLIRRGTEQETKFAERARFIRNSARDAGLNPAIFLGYWKSESHFSDYSNPRVRTGADLGCAPTNQALTTFEDSVLCAVGKSSIINSRTSQCAVSRDANSAACQAISFQQREGVKLPIATLKDFLDSYGSKIADPENINSDDTVKKVVADLGLARCVPGGGITPSSATCPLAGNVRTSTGTRTYPEGNPPSGHCGLRYPAGTSWCSEASLNGTQTSKATFAIDVSTGDRADVNTVLPKINNENIIWTLHTPLPVTSIGGGLDFVGRNPSGVEYFLHLYHLDGTGTNITGFTNKTQFNSGDTVATRLYPLAARDGGSHLHFTIAMRDTSGRWVMLEPNHNLHMCDRGGT